MLTALPVSQAEIEELLYGDDRPPAERVTRLQEMAAALREERAGRFRRQRSEGPARRGRGGHRAAVPGDLNRDPDLAGDTVTADDDPLSHRETLSPDSDELEAIEEDDEESLSDEEGPVADSELNPDDVLDPKEWDDGDGFDVDKGVK